MVTRTYGRTDVWTLEIIVLDNQNLVSYPDPNVRNDDIARRPTRRHGCFIPIEPVTKRLRPVIRNFFIATDLITTLATNMGLKMLPFTTRTVLNSSFDFGSYFYIVWRSEQCELMPLIFCRYYVIRSRILCVLFEVR